jgi:hypothetical protein
MAARAEIDTPLTWAELLYKGRKQPPAGDRFPVGAPKTARSRTPTQDFDCTVASASSDASVMSLSSSGPSAPSAISSKGAFVPVATRSLNEACD